MHKGVIDGGMEVAIKRLNSTSKQGGIEFRNEIEMLSKFRHSNIVFLIGYCYSSSEMIPVYEYMSNLWQIIFTKDVILVVLVLLYLGCNISRFVLELLVAWITSIQVHVLLLKSASYIVCKLTLLNSTASQQLTQ